MENQFEIDGIRLSWGAHDARSEGVCLLEAVAWFAGEPHSDEPGCVSPVLAAMGRNLNDRLLESDGQPDLEPRLRRLIPSLVGTAGRPDLDDKAGLMAEDFLVRRVIPVLFRTMDMPKLLVYADEFEAMDEITSWDQVPGADLRDAYTAVRDVAYAAYAYAAYVVAARVAYGATFAAVDVTSAANAAGETVAYAISAGLHEEVVSLYERMIDLYHEDGDYNAYVRADPPVTLS